MKTNLVDVFIYVKPQFNRRSISQLANNLMNTVGVQSAGINPYVKQLLAIKYNPETVSAHELLNKAKRNGVQASLVGM